MAETSKLDTINTAIRTLTAIRERIEKTMDYEIWLPIAEIDKGDFDTKFE